MISVGSTVGNYRIVRKLGAGAMATVFLAEHPRISKRVAVKVIHHDLASSPEMVSRFLAEARAASQINHEHVVDILDFGQSPSGENFMIMEYLEGQTLSARVRASERLDQATAQNIGMQIAEALITAHQRGVIHRDLKPDNIFLVKRPTNPDYVKILDFGLAKLLTGSEGLQHRTSSGSVLGTPHYMAPEQCEGRVAVDGRADIYSFGCILFHMVTGDLPFPGDGFAEVILKHLSEMPPSSRSLNPRVTPAFDKVILHCLAKNRDYRFQSAEELLSALRNPEQWSVEFGDDPMRIQGPAPGVKRQAAALPPVGPPQMATVVGAAVPGLAAMGPGGVAPELPSIASGTNVSTPRPTAVPKAQSSAPPPAAVTRIAVPSSQPPPAAPVPAADSLMPPTLGGGGTPPPAGAQLPPPSAVPPFGASASQLAAMPVVASRSAPQMATMIGEMPAAAISALAAMAPPPVSSPVASSSALRPVGAGMAMSPPGASGEAPPVAGMAPPMAASSAAAWGSMAVGPPQSYPPPGYPGAAPSSPGYPPPSAGYPPQQMVPGPGYPQGQAPGPAPSGMLPASAATPQTPGLPRNSRLTPMIGRLARQPWAQRFLAMPAQRRLLVLRGCAAGFGVLGLLLLLLLLWPRSSPVIVRSDPDQAEVLRDGESLGTTPVVLELKKGVRVKLTLRKEGYEEAVQEVQGGGEKVVLVSLGQGESGKSGSSNSGSGSSSSTGATGTKKPGGKPPPAGSDDDSADDGSDSGDSGKSEGAGGDETKKKKKKKKKKVVVF